MIDTRRLQRVSELDAISRSRNLSIPVFNAFYYARPVTPCPARGGTDPMPSHSPPPRFHFYAMHFADQESPSPLLDRILSHFTHEIVWIKVGSSNENFVT